MNYWLIAYPRADMEHCVSIGKFGLGRKYILGAVKAGDKVACIATKGEWKVIALGEVTRDYYIEVDDVFKKKGQFFDRFDFKANCLGKQELDIRTIMEDLSFITKLEHWPVYFRNAVVQMSAGDWELLEKKTKGQAHI